MFDEGSDRFAEWTPLLWAPAGAALAERARPGPGELVLDACCGGGASALPAAAAVGRSGRVDAVDLAGRLLRLGRERAAEAGWDNVRFVHEDITQWLPEGTTATYDVVQCGFGVFFLPDMDTECDRLAGLLRPGGRFALSCWAEGSLESVFHPFFAAAVEQRPELAAQTKPRQSANSERLLTETSVHDWLLARGLRDPQVGRHELNVPIDAEMGWRFLLSGPAKAVLAGLDEDALARVRSSFTARFETAGVTILHAPFITAAGTRTR